MALYTGINAYIKIPGVSPEAIIKTDMYEQYKAHVVFSEKNGGYPKFQYMLDFLWIDEVLEDTDDNYNQIHKKYTAEINRMASIVDEIDKYNLLEKVSSKELAFITRNYKLAHKFGEVCNQAEFYFREAVTYDELVQLVEACKDIWDLSWALKEAKELRFDYIFEAHVS